jgi:hypothetical protein
MEAVVTAYKFLRRDGTTPFTGFRWDLPNGEPGDWVEARVAPCLSGIHACRPSDLPHWVGPVLYEIELEGEVVEARSKLVATRGRLLRRIEAWDDALGEAYTRMCAERAHELAASVSPPLEAWAAMIEPSLQEGPGLLGFISARIGEEVSGPDAYHAERTRQSVWLLDRLGLRT